jgi:hypothetical protein
MISLALIAGAVGLVFYEIFTLLDIQLSSFTHYITFFAALGLFVLILPHGSPEL